MALYRHPTQLFALGIIDFFQPITRIPSTAFLQEAVTLTFHHVDYEPGDLTG